jgi:hypothetical protein
MCLNGSAEARLDEIATTAVPKGQKLLIQSCRRTGSARTVTQSVQFHEGRALDHREDQAGPRRVPRRTSTARRWPR